MNRRALFFGTALCLAWAWVATAFAQVAPDGFVPAAASPGAASPGFLPGGAAAAFAPRAPGLLSSGPAPATSATLALPDLPASNSDASPTASGAALAGTDGAQPAATNTEIGVARHYLYTFTIGARTVYDDNIFLSPDKKEGDLFFVLNGNVTLGLGDPTGAGQLSSVRILPRRVVLRRSQ